MFLSEEELAVQVAQINCIKIDYVNLPEASHDHIFEQFASNATGADEEDSRLEV